MPVIDTSISKFIDESLLRANAEREASHESSGRLSASMLYQPLRFQVLKTIGAPRKPMEAYTLGKFKRGTDVEDWFVTKVDEMGILVDRQKKVEYRDTIGFADAMIDTSKMQFHCGIIPMEVKSVTNAKLKRIAQTGVDYHYKMQACDYALGEGSSHFAVAIVSAEDLRAQLFIFQTGEMKHEVDKAISAYQKAMEDWRRDRTLPKFEANPNVKWTSDLKYAMFDEFWATQPDSAVITQLEALGVI